MYADRHARQLDQLTATNLCALAQFLCAINGYTACRHQRLAGSAAVDHAHNLEQVVQLDELVTQGEMQHLKGFLFHLGSMPLLAAVWAARDNQCHSSRVIFMKPFAICRPVVTLLLIAGFLTGCTTVPASAPPTDLKQQVIDTERAFARTMAERNHAAFTTFLSDETIFFSGKVLRGKTAVADAWKRLYDAPVAPFSWEPAEVEVLDSGTLAISSGPVKNAKGELIATFTSIWRREASGQWRIIFDKGNDACEKCAK